MLRIEPSCTVVKRERFCELEVAYAKLKYQACEEFSEYQANVDDHLKFVHSNRDRIVSAIESNEDGVIREVSHLVQQRDTMRDAARHIYVRGEEMNQRYENAASEYMVAEQNANRLHAELQEALKVAWKERDTSNFANDVSQQCMMQSEEINMMRRELRNRNLEVQKRDAMISSTTSQLVETRGRALELEARQHHELLVARQNVRQEEVQAREKILRCEDSLSRMKEESSTLEGIADRLAAEKKDMAMLEASVVRERDSLKVSEMNQIALPSTSSADNHRIALLNDQLKLTESTISELQQNLDTVTLRHIEACKLLDEERGKNAGITPKSPPYIPPGPDGSEMRMLLAHNKILVRDIGRIEEEMKAQKDTLKTEMKEYMSELRSITDELKEAQSTLKSDAKEKEKYKRQISELNDWNDQLADHLRDEEEESEARSRSKTKQEEMLHGIWWLR